jgi:hypothetical protein
MLSTAKSNTLWKIHENATFSNAAKDIRCGAYHHGIEPVDDSVAQFVKAFATLSLVYEPSGVVEDGSEGGWMELKETLGQLPSLKEVDQIGMKSVLNPNLISFRSKLTLEASRGLPDVECGYSLTEFRAEATTLVQVWRSSVCGESLRV